MGKVIDKVQCKKCSFSVNPSTLKRDNTNTDLLWCIKLSNFVTNFPKTCKEYLHDWIGEIRKK